VTKIYVAGHKGMVGSAIVRALAKARHCEEGDSPTWQSTQVDRHGAAPLAMTSIVTRTHAELDLTNQSAVHEFFAQEKPDQVYLAAARVGGIHANNTYPAEFIYQNLMVQANVIHAAFQNGVKKLLFLGSSCIYPRNAAQPMQEDALLTGKLEPTNEPYAISKIAGIKLCESYNRQYGESHSVDYRSVMPTNLYGPGDNYHPENSHVIPALIRRFHEAKISNAPTVTIWGTGTPRREFLYVDDMARACVHVMNLSKSTYDQHTEPMCSHINVGSGSDITIGELAQTIKHVVGYTGQIAFDPQRPDGSPQKLMDSGRLNDLGWQPAVRLKEGLALAYEDFLKRRESGGV
jgi:GDP-L-fucose synthase